MTEVERLEAEYKEALAALEVRRRALVDARMAEMRVLTSVSMDGIEFGNPFKTADGITRCTSKSGGPLGPDTTIYLDTRFKERQEFRFCSPAIFFPDRYEPPTYEGAWCRSIEFAWIAYCVGLPASAEVYPENDGDPLWLLKHYAEEIQSRIKAAEWLLERAAHYRKEQPTDDE